MRSRGGLTTVLTALVGVLALSSLSACEKGAASALSSTPTVAPISSASPLPSAALTVTPADGAAAVALGSPVSVSVADGTITAVKVQDEDGDTIDGALDADATLWGSSGLLVPASRYLVTAAAVDASGRLTELSSSFTTAAPPTVLGAKIAPLEGEVVGVGMPIVVYFTAVVTDKAAVERALTVDMSQPVEGAWHWYGSKEVHYRPAQYWPVGEQVTLHAALKGVDAGKGVWGTADRTLNFSVGDSHIASVDAKTHTMTVSVNGDVVKTFPVSTGRDKYPTTSGVHVVLEKTPSIIMDSATVGIPKGNPDYYYETVAWDVRISWSGEFVHSAPWSTASQGHENVSHGCVNASATDAEWFYNLSRRGDIVVVTNTPRPLVSGNGWTDWNMSWNAWLAGSAIYGTGVSKDAPTQPSTYGSTATSSTATSSTATKSASASAASVKPTTTPSGTKPGAATTSPAGSTSPSPSSSVSAPPASASPTGSSATP